jgi:hypothetical protein
MTSEAAATGRRSAKDARPKSASTMAETAGRPKSIVQTIGAIPASLGAEADVLPAIPASIWRRSAQRRIEGVAQAVAEAARSGPRACGRSCLERRLRLGARTGPTTAPHE